MRRLSLPGLRRRQREKKAPTAGLGGIRLLLAAIACVLVCAIVSFYLSFPTAALKDRIEQEIASRTLAQVDIGHLALLFPPGLRGSAVTITAPIPHPPFDLDTVTVEPLWSSLFGGNPGAYFQAHLQGGTLEGTVRRDGELQTAAAGIRFREPLAPHSELRVAGTLRQGSFQGALPLRPGTQTRLVLTVGRLQLSGLKAAGAASDVLDLGTLKLSAAGKGEALRVEELSLAGGKVGLSGKGTIFLFRVLDRSRLNLNIVLRPLPGLDKNLADMLPLLGKARRDGSYHLHLTGTLGHPMLR